MLDSFYNYLLTTQKEELKMEQEKRTIKFDSDLGIEAYRFEGIMQKFPNHFHEHYVIGFIEKGLRKLSCKNQEYITGKGTLLFFNPMDNHTCEQIDQKTLDYRALHIKPEVMRKAVFEITGRDYLPRFITPVVVGSEWLETLHDLHQMLMEDCYDFEKDELFYFLIKQLVEAYAEPEKAEKEVDLNKDVEAICRYIDQNYTQKISLDELSKFSKNGKYSLIRSFTKIKGITPYRYLETIRINEAKKMLEQGVDPIEAAIRTGFSDQSHFSNFFKNFIGLTPRQYRDIFTEDK